MKLHKSFLLFGTSVLLLTACADEGSNEESESTNEAATEEVTEYDEYEVMFNHGVNADYEIMGDSQNYLNLTGTLANTVDSNQVAVVDIETNIVLGISEVDENNEFYISTNMQGADNRDIIFSYDESISIPSVDDIDSLNSIVPMYYIENTYVTVDNSENEETIEKPESTSQSQSNNSSDVFAPGETAMYSSGIEVMVDSIQLTDETPNGEINGNFVRVDFTVDNLTNEEIRFTAHDIELYDGDRNKAELNAKNYYGETIASGMKGSGSAYFDSEAEGPFTVIIGAATWQSE